MLVAERATRFLRTGELFWTCFFLATFLETFLETFLAVVFFELLAVVFAGAFLVVFFAAALDEVDEASLGRALVFPADGFARALREGAFLVVDFLAKPGCTPRSKRSILHADDQLLGPKAPYGAART